MKQFKERRYERYSVEAKVYFNVSYQIRAKLKYQLIDKEEHKKTLSDRFYAITKNVSVEGLCFVSNRKFNKGDYLNLEIFTAKEKEPIIMQGEVRWSQEAASLKDTTRFESGVKLSHVNGEAVLSSTYHDGTNQITWSPVLETFFGKFRKVAEKHFTEKDN